LSAIVSAILFLFDRPASIQRPASSTAIVTARQVFGYLRTKSPVVPSTFSGWSFHTCCVVAAVTPMPSMMARWFQGSPTQKPSMLPTRMLATICGGGTVITLASFIGLIPPEASQ
jgi:predicted small integral membrane protein